MTRQLENKTNTESNGFNPGRRLFLQTAAIGTGLGTTAIPTSQSVVATTAVAQNANELWPMVGYDAANTGHSPEGTGPTNLEEVWSFETNFDIQSSPVVSNGTVYICSEDRRIYAIDQESGEAEWETELDEAIGRESPAIMGDKLFVPPFNDKIYAVDRHNGEIIWSENVGQTGGGVTAVDGTIYYGSSGNLVARNADDGNKLWEFFVGVNTSMSSTPAISDGSVYFGTTTEDVYSIDAETGEVNWNFRPFDAVWSDPAILGDTVYVGSDDENVYALDVDDGTEIWSFDMDSRVRASPTVEENRVYVAGLYTLAAINADDGSEIWKTDLPRATTSSPAVVGNLLYISSGNSVYIFDIDSGEEVSVFETEDSIRWSSPAVSSNTVYVGSTDGSLYALSESGFTVEIISPSDGEEVTEDEALEVDVEVTNTGENEEEKTIELTAPIKENTDLELAGGNTETVTFEIPSEVVYGDIGITVESPDDTDQVTVLAADPCFIATAAYDTPTAEEIDVLRNFRDDVLRRNAIGRLMIKTYYWGSPPIARWIRRNSTRRELVKQYFVEPLVSTVERYSNKWHRE